MMKYRKALLTSMIATITMTLMSESAFARQISMGELSWMLGNGSSQETINWIIDDCQADPDCSFAPVAPPSQEGSGPLSHVSVQLVNAEAELKKVERDINRMRAVKLQQTRQTITQPNLIKNYKIKRVPGR